MAGASFITHLLITSLMRNKANVTAATEAGGLVTNAFVYSACDQQSGQRPPNKRTERLRLGTGESYLSRLGIVYAHPIRLTIVRELNMREMSVPQFFEEFGGGDVETVRRHFKVLAQHGWLRKVKSATVAGAQGRPHDFYRATEIALIDTETWVSLPLSIRSTFTVRALEQLWDRIGEALLADTLDSRPDRHLTWTPLVLDQQGWNERGKALAKCFHALRHEQVDAKVRLQASNKEPIHMTVALAAFESPGTVIGEGDADNPTPAWPDTTIKADPSIPMTMKLAKVFADPLSLKILTELNLAPMSATQLHEKIGGASLYSFDRRVKRLLKLGWVVIVGHETGGRRRGGKETFYRATGPAYIDAEMWVDVPDEVKRDATWTTLLQFREKVSEALEAGTLDRRVDRHLTWLPLLVDEAGWSQVILLLEELFSGLRTAQRAARERLSRTDGEGFLATYFFAGFESPR